MYSEDELKEQEKEISTVLSYVFMPIFILSVVGVYFVGNSMGYIEKEYKEANEYSFSGVVY